MIDDTNAPQETFQDESGKVSEVPGMETVENTASKADLSEPSAECAPAEPAKTEEAVGAVVPEDAGESVGCKEPEGPGLVEVLEKYGISLLANQVELLDKYCKALWEWNKKLNLTRHDDYEKFVTRDLVDSMKLAEHLQIGEHVLDVGTGGGVPGVVLAILRPDLNIELCDSTGKKAVAVGAILDEIDLDLNVWHAKAEELVRAHRFHTLVIRAVSKLDKLLAMFAPVWFAFDRILMIKGPGWVEERGEARHFGRLGNLALRKVSDYVNPGMEHESVILQVCQKKRFEEMEKRAEEIAAGIPIKTESDIVVIEGEDGRGHQAGGKRGSEGGRKGGRKPYQHRSQGGGFRGHACDGGHGGKSGRPWQGRSGDSGRKGGQGRQGGHGGKPGPNRGPRRRNGGSGN